MRVVSSSSTSSAATAAASTLLKRAVCFDSRPITSTTTAFFLSGKSHHRHASSSSMHHHLSTPSMLLASSTSISPTSIARRQWSPSTIKSRSSSTTTATTASTSSTNLLHRMIAASTGVLGLGAFALYSTTTDCDASPPSNKKEAKIVRGSDPGTKDFYPAIEPYNTGRLKVSKIHELYYEESGSPDGKAVILLHGGPGGGTSPDFRRYFDPKVYRIIIFDQRGCGQSTPHANLEENTTWDLVADIERLRKHLGIEKATIFGGSWGSTLALTYAEEHPERVTELILRGIFMLRRKELQFYYQEGSSWFYPDIFESYRDHIPKAEQHDLMAAYHKRLTSEDEKTRLAAAREWTRWEMATSRLFPDLTSIAKADDAKYALAFARIENHFFVNKGWFPIDDYILRNVDKIRHIPTVIVQGRYDTVCPVNSAWDLFRAFPESELIIVQDAGHAAGEPGIRSELIKAADRFGARVIKKE